MSFFGRIYSCLVPCASIRSEPNGVWTGGGLPVTSCPVTPASLSLPQDDNVVAQQVRSCQRQLNLACYRYTTADGLDAPMATLATSVLTAPPVFALGQALLQVRAAFERATAGRIQDAGQLRFSTFDEFKKLFDGFEVPAVAKNWQSDQVWADQWMVGVGPYTVCRVTPESGHVGVSWPGLRAKLARSTVVALERALGEPIGNAIEAGRLYVADFVSLRETGPTPGALGGQSGLVPMAPIALLGRSPHHGSLTPLVIQLDQGPQAPFQIADGSEDWLYAKIYVQTACYQVGTLIHHVGWHHLVAEALSVTTLRQFTQSHPLYALLIHHVVGTPLTNAGVYLRFFQDAMGRHMLTGKEGGLRLANYGYSQFNYGRLDFPEDMRTRGVDDPSLLPYYPVRDDGLLYWDLIHDYVQDYLALFYGPVGSAKADARVAGDTELQGWARELSREAGGAGNLTGFPYPISSVSALRDLLQRLLFWVGPSHATLNFSALLYSLWLPNMPGLTQLRGAPTGLAGGDVSLALPTVAEASAQVSVLHEASFWFGSFLDYEDYFCGGGKNAEAGRLVARYRARLTSEIEGIIRARNLEREKQGNLSYTLLMPGEVPNSLSA